ncbi:MAG: hypothetical protein MJA27_24165 [Pseudanabaenales cyanobacterium]|nr:hypothetical protein [Pseudanabaenales cyanobacterium]
MTVKMPEPLNLVKMSQAEIDQLYQNSAVGEIPDGDSQGVAIIAAGSIFTKAIAGITQLFLWQGKVFYRDQAFFLNKATPFQLRIFKGEIYRGDSWFTDGQAIILDYSKTSFLLQRVREEIREITPGFYLAQVYWGEKRISNFTLDFQKSE